MSTYEKSVKGATKVKLAPPKSKYVEHILSATQTGEAGVAEVFRTLTHRLRDSTWTVAFKSLIVVHLMIKEGAQDVTLSYLSVQPKSKLAINHFTDVQTQGLNIRRYSDYLLARAQAFGTAKCDYVRSGEGRMKRLNVDKGLLRETEIIQEQIKALTKCDFLTSDGDNEVSLTAFRMLTRDLLDLFNIENEAVMNVLSHYFEMSRPDAERAIRIYKKFCTQTTEVVQFLAVARQYEYQTRLQIPKIKHAPTSLAKSLQDYLDDPSFEANRRQYLAEQEAKRAGKPIPKPQPQPANSEPAATSRAAPARAAQPPASTQLPKGPAPDLIDFFESIEQNQSIMPTSAPDFQQQQNAFPDQQQPQAFYGFEQTPQQRGFSPAPQQNSFQQGPQASNGFGSPGSNPFIQPFPQQQPSQQQQQQQQHQQLLQPVSSQFTGAGFGGYTPQAQQQQQQPIPGQAFQKDQQSYAYPAQAQSPPSTQMPQQTGTTNPFRQSSMPMPAFGSDFTQQQQPQRQATNPFARTTSPTSFSESTSMLQPQQQQPSQQFQQSFSPQQPIIQPQRTGTNPFARNLSPSAAASDQQESSFPPTKSLQVQQTGSTNPFRHMAFINQQTGQGWQNAPGQATMGGWESLETVPVFPRPSGMS